MKRIVAGVIAVLGIACHTGASYATEPPLRLDHTLTGLARGDATVTADYTLSVENTGTVPLAEVTLSLVPAAPLLAERTTINVGHLEAHEKRDLFIQVVSPIQLDRQRLSRMQLRWVGTYLDGSGKAVQFPVRSSEGGAK